MAYHLSSTIQINVFLKIKNVFFKIFEVLRVFCVYSCRPFVIIWLQHLYSIYVFTTLTDRKTNSTSPSCSSKSPSLCQSILMVFLYVRRRGFLECPEDVLSPCLATRGRSFVLCPYPTQFNLIKGTLEVLRKMQLEQTALNWRLSTLPPPSNQRRYAGFLITTPNNNKLKSALNNTQGFYKYSFCSYGINGLKNICEILTSNILRRILF